MKNILIIGHSSGIGKALTEVLAPKYQIYGTFYKNKPDQIHSNVNSFYLNVEDSELNFDALPDTLDGFVYCPGAIQLKPFSRIKPEDFIKDYELQVIGAIRCLQACLPRLKKSSSASVVLFSTVAVKMGFNFHSIVSSSKGAIEGLTKALAAELAPNIRVNCVAPSITETPLAHSLLNTPEKIEANAQRHPLKKIGSPIDAANLTSFLLGEESQWITGQIMALDGGVSTVK